MSFKFNFYNTPGDVTKEETSIEDKENSLIMSESTLSADNKNTLSADNIHNVHSIEGVVIDDSSEWLTVTLTPDIKHTSSPVSSVCSADSVSTVCYLANATFGGIASLISTTDLIPGVYEGGFTLWECTLDLLQYMVSHPELVTHATLNTVSSECDIKHPVSSVLDLGCGAGLLGILACKMNSRTTCHFQDFNSDVIKNFTIPNYVKNVSNVKNTEHNVSSECRAMFYSGDWSTVSSHFTQYDLILASEVIYNRVSQSKILTILSSHLSSHGVALVASKRHYFGVGGGVYDFVELVTNSDSGLVCEVVWSSEGGLSRDIIMITHG